MSRFFSFADEDQVVTFCAQARADRCAFTRGLAATPLQPPALRPEDLKSLAEQLMTPRQVKEFTDNKECDFAIGVPGIGRFRCNVYQQRGSLCYAMRAIPYQAKTLAELNLPPVLADYDRMASVATAASRACLSVAICSSGTERPAVVSITRLRNVSSLARSTTFSNLLVLIGWVKASSGFVQQSESL